MSEEREQESAETDARRAQRRADAFAHPIRVRLLNALASDSGLRADALAKRVQQPLSSVEHHLDHLVSIGSVEAIGEAGRRGESKAYRVVEGGGGMWTATAEEGELLPIQDRSKVTAELIRVIFEEATRSASSLLVGSRPGHAIANISNRVDERGWSELGQTHHQLLERVAASVAGSRARLGSGSGKASGIISEQILLVVPRDRRPMANPEARAFYGHRDGGLPPSATGGGWAGEEKAERARRLAAAIADPMRMKLIIRLTEDSPLAADDLAERVAEPPHRVRRHLNALLAAGILRIAHEESRRGTVKRFFALERAPLLDDEEVASLSERDRRRSCLAQLRLIADEAMLAASSPLLGERTDRIVANVANRVDEQGWHELARLHQDALDQMIGIVIASRERLASSGETPIAIVSAQIFLEAPQNLPDNWT